MAVTRFALSVRDRPLVVDELSAEVALGPMSHLSSLNIKPLRLDIELVEGTRSQADKHFLPIIWVTFFRAVGQYPVLAILTIASGPKRDCLCEVVWDVVPFIVSKPGLMTRRTWVLGVNIVAHSPASSNARLTTSSVGAFRYGSIAENEDQPPTCMTTRGLRPLSTRSL